MGDHEKPITINVPQDPMPAGPQPGSSSLFDPGAFDPGIPGLDIYNLPPDLRLGPNDGDPDNPYLRSVPPLGPDTSAGDADPASLFDDYGLPQLQDPAKSFRDPLEIPTGLGPLTLSPLLELPFAMGPYQLGLPDPGQETIHGMLPDAPQIKDPDND